MLQYENMRFEYEPFPIGVARPVFEPGLYKSMVESFPPIELFEYKADKGDKYSLSQVNNAGKYRRYVQSSPPWRAFHQFIRSGDFVSGALDMLKRQFGASWLDEIMASEASEKITNSIMASSAGS